ncbi:MAG TPA: class I SAM-dependent methyltransferase [Saprospiraceae bacterium]|nr:class I SAM-dependent methyltransferase [Saprospiraceae bacterium]
MLNKIYKFLSSRYQTLFLDYKVEMKPRYGHGKPPHGTLYDIIDQKRGIYQDLLREAMGFEKYIAEIKDSTAQTDRSQPVWNNGFLPGLDIIGIYTLIARYRPSKYIEVGSGNSTKVAFKAKKDHNLAMEITSIDPMPRAEIDHLADRVIRQPFENTDLSLIDELNENDVLFIDNSHRILPNSDAMVFFMDILPRLKRGVIVHIHDIYLPYDYPQFMCDRAYSEQYGLAFYLLANAQKYQPLFPAYFISEDKELASLIEPIWNHKNLLTVERHGGSFWLRIG